MAAVVVPGTATTKWKKRKLSYELKQLVGIFLSSRMDAETHKEHKKLMKNEKTQPSTDGQQLGGLREGGNPYTEQQQQHQNEKKSIAAASP